MVHFSLSTLSEFYRTPSEPSLSLRTGRQNHKFQAKGKGSRKHMRLGIELSLVLLGYATVNQLTLCNPHRIMFGTGHIVKWLRFIRVGSGYKVVLSGMLSLLC
jgi:hypothetical protein